MTTQDFSITTKAKMKKSSKATGVKEFVMSRFSTHFERKPDATEFKKWATLIKYLTHPDDEDCRSYSVDEVVALYDYAVKYGCHPYEIEFIMTYGLIAAITDNKLGLANGILEDIKKRQNKKYDTSVVPNGW